MSDQEQELYMAMGISELESEVTTLTTRLAAAEKVMTAASGFIQIQHLGFEGKGHMLICSTQKGMTTECDCIVGKHWNKYHDALTAYDKAKS